MPIVGDFDDFATYKIPIRSDAIIVF